MVKREEIIRHLTDEYVNDPTIDDGRNLEYKESVLIVEALIKRDTPVLVTGEGVKDEWYTRWWDCPVCGKRHTIASSYNFCPMCGSRLEHKK